MHRTIPSFYRGSTTFARLWIPTVVILLAAPTAWGQEGVREEIPPCGPACVYTILRLTGRDASVDSVRNVFLSIDPNLDWRTASVWHVREALAASGVACSVRKYQSRDLDQLGVPAILYFEPGHWIRSRSRSVGHFVVLTGISRDAATIADWNADASRVIVEMPTAELQSAWGGYAIVVEGNRSFSTASMLFPALGAAIGLVIGTVGGLRAAGRGKGGKLSAVGLVLVTLILGGCGGGPMAAEHPDPPPLIFDMPSVDLGRREKAESVTTRFKFNVHGDSAVRIVAVETSCGCSTADESVIDQLFEANSIGEISLVTHLRRGIGVQSVFAKVETDPASATPLLLALRYQLGELPRPTVASVHVDGSPDKYAEATVEFTHRRSAHAQPLVVIRERSEATDFQIVELEAAPDPVAADPIAGETVVVDRVKLKLKTKEKCRYGTHHGSLRLHWSDGESTEMPTYLRVVRPVEPALSQVFAGVLAPEQEWTISVPCQLATPGTPPPATIETTGAKLQARFSADGKTLEIRGTAPKSAGRFSGTVTLKYAAPEIPALEIPISGVVTQPDAQR